MESTVGLVSVVIPTYNRKSSINEVLTPLLNDPGVGEIVIVDDGSTDGTTEFLSQWAKDERRIRLLTQENAGQEFARRRGLEESEFEIVVLLDDDVVPGVGLASAHARWHVSAENRLVVGYSPITLSSVRTPGQAPATLYAEDYESTCSLYEADSHAIFSHFWAGNISMRRATALSVSSSKSGRLGYHEDMRFGLLCERAGLEPIFDRALRARHSYGKSLRTFSSECRRSGESRALLEREFPEFADEIDPLRTMSARERVIATYCGSVRLEPLMAPIIAACSIIAGRLRTWRLERVFVRILRIVELSYGYKRAKHSPE